MRTLTIWIVSILACGPILGADPEKPINLTAKNALTIAALEGTERKTAAERFEDKLVKVTAKVQFNHGVSVAGPYESYSVRFGTSSDKGKYLILNVVWADTPAAARLKKQVEKAGRDGVSLTVYGRLSGLADPSGNPPKLNGTAGDPKEVADQK